MDIRWWRDSFTEYRKSRTIIAVTATSFLLQFRLHSKAARAAGVRAPRVPPMLRRIWDDPVWSKVISDGIIAVLVSIWAYIAGYTSVFMSCLRQAWIFATSYSSVPNWALGVGALLALATLIRIVVLAWPHKPEGRANLS